MFVKKSTKFIAMTYRWDTRYFFITLDKLQLTRKILLMIIIYFIVLDIKIANSSGYGFQHRLITENTKICIFTFYTIFPKYLRTTLYLPKFSFVRTLTTASSFICWTASFLLMYQFVYNIVIMTWAFNYKKCQFAFWE